MFVPRSLNRQAGERLVVFSELRNAQRKGFTSNVSVVNAQVDGSDTALLKIDRLFCQAIPRVIESGPEILLCGSRWERQATRLPLCKVHTRQPHLSESLLFNTSTNGKAMLSSVNELKIWSSNMFTRLLLLCTTRISLYNFHFSVRLALHFTTLTSFNLKFRTKVRYLSSAGCHRKEHADHRSTSSTPKYYCSPLTQRFQSCRPEFHSTIITNHPQS